jgi:hypothetical protein
MGRRRIRANSIYNALSGDRDHLIACFLTFLPEWIKELDCVPLHFWLSQLRTIDANELPITLYGVAQAKRELGAVRVASWRLARGLGTAAELGAALWNICELVFTYSRDDDLCEMQGQYHYYFFIPEAIVYKESDLGSCDLTYEVTSFHDQVRVATVSDLGIPADELL